MEQFLDLRGGGLGTSLRRGVQGGMSQIGGHRLWDMVDMNPASANKQHIFSSHQIIFLVPLFCCILDDT